jgi:hypothetical protein
VSETTIRIGGQDISVPEMNFKALKRVFPLIKKMEADQENEDEEAVMDDVVSFLEVVLARSSSPMKVEEIEEALLVSELPALQPAVMEILQNNGLRRPPGEPSPVEEVASPSTGTSTQSSVSSSPDSEAQTGTE